MYSLRRHTIPHPQAMYRKVNGAEWFMGIVLDVRTLEMFKLDDPTEMGLIGSGHYMDDNEFFTECFHYDNFSQQHAIPPIQLQGFALVDFAHKPPPSLVDGCYYQPSENVVEQDVFDFMYPHGIPPPSNRQHIGPIPQIRKGDRVCIVLVLASRNESVVVLRRTFGVWVKVWSVMAVGIVTGHIVSQLLDDKNDEVVAAATVNLRQGDLIAFEATKVLGVVHGENWS